MFECSEEKEEGEEVVIGSDARETPIHATNQDDINYILDDGYEVDDDRLPYPEKNSPLQAILNNQYINRYENKVA